MKCTHCNFTTAEKVSYCPNCGAPMVPDEQPTAAPGAEANVSGSRVFAALGDKLFLVLCILISVSTVFSLVISNWGGVVIGVLYTIFVWMVYSARVKGNVDAARLRCLSGVLFAQKICGIVAGAFITVGGILSLVIAPVLGTAAVMGLINDVLSEFGLGGFGGIAALASGYLVLVGISLLIGGVAAILISIFGIGKMHHFVRSVYMHELDPRVAYDCVDGARKWAIVYAVFTGLGVLSGGIGIIVNGCICASYIIFSMLIGKYFKD